MQGVFPIRGIFFCIALLLPLPARAEFAAEFVQVPITAAAISANPELASAQTWQLRITADHDLLSMEIHTRISGATLFQHALGTADGPPTDQLQAFFPSLAFDSYLDLPGTSPNAAFIPTGDDLRSYYNGPFDFTTTSVDRWLRNAPNDAAPIAYTAAQLTLVPTSGPLQHDWLVRLYERTPTMEVIEHVVVSPGTTSPFGADVNYDFTVDGDDLAIWKANFGRTAEAPFEFSPADRFVDFDGDGDTDHFDGAILLMNQETSPATREQGDVDGDGVINANDQKVLFDYEWGHKWNSGDLNQDLRVDGADFLQWQRQFGFGFPAAPSVQLTPEPGMSTFVGWLCVMGFVFTRRTSHEPNRIGGST